MADIQLQGVVAESPPVIRHRSAEALDAIRELYKIFIAERTGYIHRGKSLWLNGVLSEDGANETDGSVYVALAGSLQEPRGYVVYTLRAGQVPHRARPQEIKIRDKAFLDMAACQSLWQFLARHDLVGRVTRPKPCWPNLVCFMFRIPRPHDGGWWMCLEPWLSAAMIKRRAWLRRFMGMPWHLGTVVAGCCKQPGTRARKESQVGATDLNSDITLSIRALSGLFSGMYSAQTLANWGMLRGLPQVISAAG